MRKLINLIESMSHVPAEYEEGDKAHYDAFNKTGFFGAQAAGCVFVARSTGRMMLVHRSEAVEQPFTWGNCGGAHHEDETPIDAARREGYEETGYTGHIDLVPAFVFTSGTFRYSNFFAVVEDEFVPELGWEATDYKWCTLDDMPAPLHFGIEALFGDAASLNAYKAMQPEGQNQSA